MSSILIVDDEPQIRRALALNLGVRGYEVWEAPNGEIALQQAATEHPDLVLLDLGLPVMDGLTVLAALRRWSDVPVVVLTARGDEPMMVRALDAGADDYVTKPFGMGELLARLRAVLRRATAFVDVDPVVHTAWFDIDLVGRQALAGDPRAIVHLTRTEWSIVEELVRHPGRLVPYPELVSAVWGPGADVSAGLIRVHVASVRRKLERDPGRPDHILTDSGVGLRFLPPPKIGD